MISYHHGLKNKAVKWAAVLALAALLMGVFSFAAGKTVWAAENTSDGDRFEIVCGANRDLFIPDSIEAYPIVVQVTNNGADFEGMIKLLMYTGADRKETIAWGQYASIQMGETASFYFYIQEIYFDVLAYNIPVRIDLLDVNGNLVCQESSSFSVEADGSASISAGVIGQDAKISRLINNTIFDYESYYSSGKLSMQSVELNEEDMTPQKLRRFNMLVLDEDVSDDAWEKLSQWLISGGNLLINQSVYDSRIGKPLNDIGMASWGIGRVIVYENNAMNSALLIQSVKNLLSQGEFYTVLSGNSSYWDVDYKMGYDLWSRVQSAGKYLIVLAVYIVIIGPAAYIFLKKKERREYLWGIIPCMALIFSVFIWLMGHDTRYTDSFLRYSTILQLTEEGNVEKTSMMLTSPDKEQTVLTLEGDRHIGYVTDSYYWNDEEMLPQLGNSLENEDYDLAIMPSANKTDVIFNSRTVFDKTYLSSGRVFDSEYGIEGDLTYYDGGFSGNIVNGTPWNLKNAFVYYEGIFLMLGDLQAGESVRLDQAQAEGTLSFMQDNFDPAVYGSQINVKAAEYMMNRLLSESVLSMRVGQAVVGAFTQEYDIGVVSGSELVSVDGLTLVLADISIADSGDGWLSQAMIRGRGITDRDRACYDPADFNIYENQPFELSYQLEDSYPVTYLRWLDVDENIDVAFYNQKTAEYDAVFEETAVMDGTALEPYIDGQNRIRVRIQITDFSNISYIPAFTVTGGETGG